MGDVGDYWNDLKENKIYWEHKKRGFFIKCPNCHKREMDTITERCWNCKYKLKKPKEDLPPLTNNDDDIF